jgi:four helix bundle protein
MMPKLYDLEQRTFEFARSVRAFTQRLPKSLANTEDIKQVVRSSGSVGANYIEANESLSNKDKLMRLKISLKEAKESKYWLKLMNTGPGELDSVRNNLIQEATELSNIFASIIIKLK